MFEMKERLLELKYAWKLSRNTSDFKVNFFIKYSDGRFSGTGEVAPNIRYGETPELIKAQFAVFCAQLEDKESRVQDLSLNSLSKLLDNIELAHVLRFGIESAFVHYFCKANNKSIYELLEIKAPVLPLETSYSIPIMPPEEIKRFYDENHLERFSFLKVKVNKEEGYDIIKEVHRCAKQPLMIDGNECWGDVEELLIFMDKLRRFPVMFIEQPMPAKLDEEYYYLKKYSKYELIADESCTNEPDFGKLKKQFHGVNMKLMKAGGYLNGIRILDEARKHGMKTMIGCMVETSIGIAAAMHLANGINYIDLDGFLILKDEPFGLVKEDEGRLRF